jgi:hypothetical protein
MSRILLPSEIGSQLQPHLTVDGVKQLIADLTKMHGRKPSVLMLNEHDRREMNQRVMDTATQPVAKQDQRPEHDGEAIGYIDGVAIVASREISRGKCRPIYGPQTREVSDRLGGEGKIIVGA